jgi:WS/DGAT/MGAT family acyltransferase
MSIERLSAEDELMLWPDEVWPQDIGALAVLDGRGLVDEGGRFRIEAMREAIEARLHLVPRLRQLLSVPPRRLGGPLWVDAPAFDVADHVRVVALEPPGDEARLLLAIERLRRRRLDRRRPLWEMWFLTGLPERRVALFVRMHHCIADGIASVATMAAFLDPAPDAPPPTRRSWTPAPAPTEAELLADRRSGRRRRRRRTLATLAHPVAGGRRLLAAWPSIRELLAERPAPATSLDRLVGPDRALALVRSRLDVVQEVAHAHGATVNDVLLAMTAGGLRGLLGSRGEPVGGVVLPIYVPVSLHQGPRARARGNLVSQMVVPLPVGVSDPATRLRQIARETARRKAMSHPSLGKMPHRGPVGRVFLKLLTRQRVNVTSTDLPGPETPLYLAGARLLEVFPLVQLIGSVSLAVGAMSYAGRFDVLAVADRDAYPDLDVFARSAEDELGALAGATRSAAPAWSVRRST